MDDSMLNKLIASIKWHDEDLRRVITLSKSACMKLHQRGVAYRDFFAAAMTKNPYIALILLQHIYKLGCLETQSYDECKALILRECLEKMECFLETRQTNFYEYGEESVLDYFATALLLDDSELGERALKVMQMLPENKEQAALFLRNMFKVLHYTENKEECCARLYEQMYFCFPIEWCEHIAYHQGIEIPIMEQVPVSLKKLVHKAWQNQHMRFFDLVLKVFVNVQLHQLEIQADELMQSCMQIREDNIFRGILLTEKLIATDTSSAIEALEIWWLLLNKYENPENPFWIERKYWFHTYYFSRQIYYNPSDARRYIEQMPFIPTGNFKVRKINEVIQNAMETLFLAKEKLVFEYMEKLGDNNAFRFVTDEEYYPRYEKNASFNHEDAIENLFAIGYDRTEIIDIYMNSFLRSCYSFVPFMRKVFEEAEERPIFGDYADVSRCFQKYKIKAYVKIEDGIFGLLLHNVFNNQKHVYFAPDWWQKNNDYCRKMLTDNQKVYCNLSRLSLNSFIPSFELCLEPEEMILAQDIFGDNFERYMEYLEEIARKKELTTKMNNEIVRLCFPLPLSDENWKRMNLQIVKCLVALSENRNALRYMINMVNIMISGKMNIYKYRLDFNIPKMSDADMLAEIRTYWQKFCEAKPTLEDIFFVYINTIFKQCISFSELVRGYCDSKCAIMDLSKLLSKHTDYCFSGKIISVSKDIRSHTPCYYVKVQPLAFCLGKPGHYDSFFYRTNQNHGYEEGQHCYFRIGAYNSKSDTFYIKELLKQHELHKAVPISLFKSAMSKVAVQKEITGQMMNDLTIDLPPLSEKDIDNLIMSMIRALEYRCNEITEINNYLEMIEKNNPWRFSVHSIAVNYYHNGPDNPYISGRIKKLFEKLVQQYDLRSVLFVYFNSILKVFIPLNTVLMAYCGKGIYADSLDVWMKEYPLLLSTGTEEPEPINFRGNNIAVTSEANNNIFYLKEYKAEENLLILE